MDPRKPELILTNEKFKVTYSFVQEYFAQFIDIENAEFLIVRQEQLDIIEKFIVIEKTKQYIILQIPKKLQLTEYLVKDHPDLLK
jgi:hypothetical protein